MSKRLVSSAAACLWVALAALAGCAGPPAGRGNVEPTVEPLTEVEFDAFATEIAEQIIAWLERGQVSLPVTIAPPAIENDSVEWNGVVKSFSRRFANGLSDRLLGAAEFGRARGSGPRLRCGIAFTDGRADRQTRTVTFRLWDADSNLEICRGSYDYQIRPRPLTALRRRLEERRLAQRTPREERESSTPATVPPVDQPTVASAEPAEAERLASRGEFSEPEPEPDKTQSEPSVSEPVVAAGETVQPERVATAPESAESNPVSPPAEPTGPVIAGPVGEADAVAATAVTEAVASDHESAAKEKIAAAGGSATVVEGLRSADRRPTPPRRTVRIDRHEGGLAELVQAQAVYFSDHTITDELGRMIFLDRRAWESIQIRAQQARRTRDGHLSIKLLVRAHGRPLEADLRVIYLDADGRQVEVSPVRTYEFSPSYTKNIVLHSSKAGIARYIVLVSHG